MKKVFLALAVFAFVSFSLSAQVSSSKKNEPVKSVEQQKLEKQKLEKERLAKGQANNPQANNPNAPIATFDKLVHDYGTMEQYADGNCEFVFTNTGKEPLILSNVRASWGCTTPAWPRQPVLPGQSETIKVKYDTKRVGTINKTIRVYSNATTSPINLKIKGKILAKSAAKMPEKSIDQTGTPVNK